MGSRITTTTNVGRPALYTNVGVVIRKNVNTAAQFMPVTVTAVPVPKAYTGPLYPGLRRATAPTTPTSGVTGPTRSNVVSYKPTVGSLNSKLLRILAEGGWHTLASLAQRTRMSKDSVSSALRRMRAPEYGNHNIVSNKGADRKWRYANMSNLARNDRRFAEGMVQSIAA